MKKRNLEGDNVIQNESVGVVTTRPVDLPDFSDPPVVETLLSAQFDRLALPRTAHFGLYWSEIRSRYPVTQEQGELPSILEGPPGQPQIPLGIRLETLEAPPTPRFWFIDAKGGELIQVQRDRFIKNWRKAGEGDEYPRYENVREGFDQDFKHFADFLKRNDLGDIRVNQCEVTYINHIVAGEVWQKHSEIEKVFTPWHQPVSAFPGPAEGVSFWAGFRIHDDTGEFRGRLHVKVQPAARIADGRPMFVMELTARGQIGEGTEFFDLGRRWIVKSFAELTSPEMHQIWGRRN